MAKIAIDCGHGLNTAGKRCMKKLDPNETREWVLNNRVGVYLDAYLKSAGHQTLRVDDVTGKTDVSLADRVKRAEEWNADLYFSVHHNAGINGGTGGGTVIYVYIGTSGITTKTQEAVYKHVIAQAGLKGNRSDGTLFGDFYVIRETSMPANLIECGFMDSSTDIKYILNPEWSKKVAYGIALGICEVWGGTVKETSSSSNTSTDSSKLYRVRKSWEDEKSQIGAYANLDNAKAACKEGYTVYDWNGKAVYSVPVETETKEQLYRVRKTWADSKSQIGAYKDLNNAKNACPEGYSVFDESGKAVYTKPVSTPEEPKQEQEKESITPTIISPLKGLSNEEFIEYVGARAKADMDKTGVLASVTIAQAILESSWGQSELSLYANNLFGMKTSLSGNTWDSEWTGEKYSKETKEEYEPGVITTITADFRAYKTVEASIKDHSDYLLGAKKGSELRYKGLKDEMDYKKAIQIIKDGGYATDSSYVDKICGIIEKYNLDEYDKKEEVIIPDVTVKPDDNEFEEVHGKLDTILKALETILTIVTNIAEAIKRIFK